MITALSETQFKFPNLLNRYEGKVRDIYYLHNDLMVMVVTDRISAFDVVLPQAIPYKGQVLNQITTTMLQASSELVPNWLIAVPDANVAIGKKCQPFKVEMVIRAYLCGHAAREYNKGKRILCGIPLEEGLKSNDKLEYPIITPSTKAEDGGHDQDISKEEILSKGLVTEEDYEVLENYTRILFAEGSKKASERGLLLADTKYEFGKTPEGKIVVIDEIHTPDSSRYFYAKGYNERQEQLKPQKQLSKEFVRQWLLSNNFSGLAGSMPPAMDEVFVQSVSARYIELYEKIMGKIFEKAPQKNIEQRIYKNVMHYLEVSA